MNLSKIREEKVLVEYFSNNSGGRDWLSEEDWAALKEAGWHLYGFDNFTYKDGEYALAKSGYPKVVGKVENPHYALKYFSNVESAQREFEKITGQSVDEQGCPCCGQPHNFSIS